MQRAINQGRMLTLSAGVDLVMSSWQCKLCNTAFQRKIVG